MLGIETLIVFAVASFHFAVMPRRICSDLLVYYSVYVKYSLEQRRIRFFALVVSEVFCKFPPVVCLHTFNRELKELNRMLRKYCGRVAAILRKRFQITLSRELVYCREIGIAFSPLSLPQCILAAHTYSLFARVPRDNSFVHMAWERI